MKPNRHDRRTRAYAHRVQWIQKRINLLAVLRLLAFLGIVVGVSFLFGGDYQLQGATVAFIAVGIFLYLMVVQDRCYRYKERCSLLRTLAEDDSARAEYRFADLSAEGLITFEDGHPFAHDLDFAKTSSLMKLIDDSFHQRTKALLKQWIDHPASVSQIKDRQEAILDLTGRKRFRLRLALAARLDSVPDLAPEDFQEWLDMPVPWTLRWPAYLVGRLVSLMTLTVLVLHFFFGIAVPWLPFVLLQLIVFYGMDLIHGRFCLGFLQRGKSISATCAIIRQFEKLTFSSQQLQDMQRGMLVKGKKAGPNLTKLLGFQEMLRYRENGFAHLLLNGLFMWDQHYLRRLVLWREAYGAFLKPWVQAIFELEALCALANYRWLYPERPFPQLEEGAVIHLEAEDLAHPCIHEEKRVGNDYRITHDGLLHLVTGSNMSGKSTFLRTIAVNMVLARLGAPVCARSMTCSLPRIWTSIQIQDSLAEGISYFYAEVRRIKRILDEIAVEGPPVFYFLDEIFKGTNSRERLIACKAMVDYLINHQASGLITTHDLELLNLTGEQPDRIANYHFQEQVRDGEMFFDYKLKPGSITSTNALRVMRFAGVPLAFEEE